MGDTVLAATPNPKLPQHRAVFALHLHATCLGATIISGTGKAIDFKLCTHIHRVNRKKAMKKMEKNSHGLVRESRKFSGHPYIGRIARSSLR